MKKAKSEIQIFLAHATEDKQRVRELYAALKARGYRPWLDEEDLIGGQNWRVAIPEAIKGCDLFIACLSSTSIAKQGYVQREFRLALDLLGERPEDQIFLIPLRLDDCRIPNIQIPQYGLNLQNYHRVDYWKEDWMERLEQAIDTQFGPWEPEKPAPSLQLQRFQVVTVNAKGEIINREKQQAQYLTENLPNGATLELAEIPGGTFWMGTEDAEIERLCQKFGYNWFKRERPQHRVTVSPFLMGKYPVTQKQWREIANLPKIDRDLNPDPSHFKGDNRPVECVSWDDTVEFCQRLSQKTGKDYRLPSEAEWEYACRAGTTTPFYFGETITNQLANYHAINIFADEPKGKWRQETTPVGEFPANAFGLYDMHGNVWEWCADTWHENYDGAPLEGRAWTEARNNNRSHGLVRGGFWEGTSRDCRSAYRGYNVRVNCDNTFGFRVCCVPPRVSS
jgi:formylglycine-generating enzyme required for sulfatase activity